MTRTTIIFFALILLLAPKGATSAERHSLRNTLQREIGEIVRGFDDEAVVDVELTPARPKELLQLPGTSIIVDSTMVAQDDSPDYSSARVTIHTRLGKLSGDAENLIRRKAAFLATDVKIFYGLPLPGFKTPERRLNNEQIKAESKNAAALRSAVTAAIERAPMFTELDLPANSAGTPQNGGSELSTGVISQLPPQAFSLVSPGNKNGVITQPAQVSLLIQPAPLPPTGASKAAGATINESAPAPSGNIEHAPDLARLDATVNDVVRLAMIAVVGGGILLLLVSIERSWQNRKQIQTLTGGLKQVIEAIAEKSNTRSPDLFSDLDNIPHVDDLSHAARSSSPAGPTLFGGGLSPSRSGSNSGILSAERSPLTKSSWDTAKSSSTNALATAISRLPPITSDVSLDSTSLSSAASSNPATYPSSIAATRFQPKAKIEEDLSVGPVAAAFAAFSHGARIKLEQLPDHGLSALVNDCYWSGCDGQAAYVWRRLSAMQRSMLTTRFPRLKDYAIFLSTVSEQPHEFEQDPYYLDPLPIDHLDSGALSLAIKTYPPLYARLSAIRASVLKLSLNERLEFSARAGEGVGDAEIAQLRSTAPSLPRTLTKREPIRVKGVEEESQLLGRVGEFDLAAIRSMPSLVWSERLSDESIRELLSTFNATDLASAWIGPESVLIRLHGLLPERKSRVLDSYLTSIEPSRESEAFKHLFERLVQCIEDESGDGAAA